MSKIGLTIVPIALAAAVIAAGFGLVWAQTTQEQVSAERATLQQQLAQLEKDIANYQQQLKTLKGQKNTLQNKIAQLKKQQEALTAQIKLTSLQLDDLDLQEIAIQKEADAIRTRSESLRTELGETVRNLAFAEGRPFVYSLILANSLTEAFAERNDNVQLVADLGRLLGDRRSALADLAESERRIADARDAKNQALKIQAIAQSQLLGSVSEQNTLLKQTKGKESAYQNQLSDKQKEVAAIRNRLYQLLEVSKQITFGQAVTIAQWASAQTGVRAAFLLAVLTQESNLGANVGTCNRAGDPPSKSWKVVMKPERDHEPFKKITSELGLNIDTTPVSCPMRDKKGNQIGWGGAMGPAQFIPSTWMGYRAKVTAITGKAANPWDIRDAFLAAAIKLKADGAGTQSGEWAAAMKYFSGTTNTAYRFYGDNVVKLAEEYAADIVKLNQ
jgi:membrane-bound lytic murein transglycosylase B